MTSEAPERIWRWFLPNTGWVEYSDIKVTSETSQEYIRADHALALVAEAYEGAAEIYEVTFDSLARLIRALTPADAQAAREARDRKVREEALREAAREAGARDWGTSDPRDKLARRIAKDILALIEGDTDAR